MSSTGRVDEVDQAVYDGHGRDGSVAKGVGRGI